MPEMTLFCFPYAGGSAILFNKWRPYLDPRIEIVPVELAGRGTRINDALYEDLPGAVEDVFRIVEKKLNGGPYGFFGHSLGSTISYHLAQRMRGTPHGGPAYLFFSGQSAPHLATRGEKMYHLMDDEIFKKEIRLLGGTPPEFFQYPELMDLFLPLLKNDFKLAETVTSDKRIEPFDIDITVFIGKEDEFGADQCDGWKMHTNQRCTLHYFDGGHFFLNNATVQMAKIINSVLN